MVDKILFGPAGTGGAGAEGFEAVKKTGLDAVELEFVYSIWLNKQQAEKLAELNKKWKLVLSIHAPYYINLNSKEKAKIAASRTRILKCLEIGTSLGAKYVVFHPGFYQGMPEQETYKNIKEQIEKIQSEAKEKHFTPQLAPETTGKPSQFGSLDELLRLRKETGCSICIDFAHLKARSNGKLTYEEMAEKIASAKLGHIHCHFSGIEFSEKGERKHLFTEDKDIKELLTAIKKHNLDCTIINESPDPLGDSIKMKKLLARD
jgi:deoxyribonuclease-4